MAWRWGEDPPSSKFVRCFNPEATTEPDRPTGVPSTWEWKSYENWEDVAGWREPTDEAHLRQRGFCGKAGPWFGYVSEKQLKNQSQAIEAAVQLMEAR
jgi:hypothetical protein